MAQKLKIETLKFKSGSKPGATPLEVDTPNVTILVGPNNSGKSLTLREIEDWCLGKNPELKTIEEISLEWPDTIDDFEEMLLRHKAAPPRNQIAQPDHIWVSRPVIRQGEESVHQQINENSARQWFEQKHVGQLLSFFVRLYTLRLDGRTRFDLVDPKDTGPLEEHPQNHLWALFVNDEGREKVRQFTEEAFGRHFVIDPTGMRQFRVRASDARPPSKAIEQGLDHESREFHKASPLISDLGDGLRTSIGLVSAVMSVSHQILLIDEPEAFLHPTLARRVGNVLTTTARERDASMIVATHSADFLMGCIQATPDLRLVRLTYSNNQPTSRSIDPREVTLLMQDPLLRSSNALRALFHRGVIITEADADRAFYEEINNRLLQNSRGSKDTLFLNAQNWQTIPRLVAPLRKLGIPAAAIFDLDVLLEDDFRKVWPLLNVQGAELQRLQNERNTLKAKLETVGRPSVKQQGINALDATDQAIANQFIQDMASYGVFFVPLGELESWLSSLGVQRTSDKPAWLTNIFNALGSDPSDPSYVAAGDDDVWLFIDSVEAWVDNPDRLGIPE